MKERLSTAARVAAIVVALSLPVGVVAWNTAQITGEQHRSCVEDLAQYDALRRVIVESYKPQPPNPVIVELLPQLAPLYTPGNPQYEASRARTLAQRNRILAVLGPRRPCRP